MNDNVIEVTLRINDQGAITALDQAGNKLEAVAGKARDADSGFSKFQSTLITANQAIQLLDRGLSFVVGAFSKLSSALDEAGKIEGLTASFDNLQESVGLVASDSLVNLRSATQGMISDLDLMQQSNQAVLLGLPTEGFDELAEAAVKLGRATGRTATEALGDLITGLGRASPLILDNLGIVVKAADAQELYAAKLGKTVDKLTESEKAEAFRAAAMDKILKKSKELAKVEETAAVQMAKVTATLENMTAEFLKSLSGSDDLADSLSDLNDVLKNVDVKGFAEDIAYALSVVVDFTRKLLDLANTLKSTISPLFESFGDKVRGVSDKVEDFVSQIQNLRQKVSQAETKGDIERLTEAALALGKGIQDAGAETDEITILFGALQKHLDLAHDRLPAVAKGFSEIGEAAEKTAKKVEKANEALHSPEMLGPGNDAGYAEFMQQGGSPEAAFFQQAQAMAASFLQVFSHAISSGDWSNIMESVGSEIGSQFGPIGEFLGPLAGGWLDDAIKHIFGGEHAHDTARKSIDSYFKEIFDAAPIMAVIEGELVKIKDLMFQSGDAFGSGEAFTAFDAMSQQAKNAFTGVDIALMELLGVTENISGHMAATFATNLGGSLNNLQILIKQTGLSFEQLAGAVVDAFEKGEISASEAHAALIGIKKTAEKGIPDAFGAVDLAFENMKNAGAKGGIAVIDALQDIGHEAHELSYVDLADAMEHLVQTGKFSTDEISAVFEALSSHGITTVEQLANATTEQLLPVLAELENKQILDVKEPLENIQALIDKVESIPKNIDKYLTYHVKTEVDQNTQNYVGKDLVPSAPGIS